MPLNVEIKARTRDAAAQMQAAARLADGPPAVLELVDTYFRAARGRLKLREAGSAGAELIHYDRPDMVGPRSSTYVCVPVADPDAIKAALGAALGVREVVAKRRTLFLAGRTRIHFDEVRGLGSFIELEVVLEPGQPSEEGVAVARRLMAALGITESDLVGGAYVDLLEERAMDEVSALLVACDLPVADLRVGAAVHLICERRGGRLVGVVGVEVHGEDGLLRSLAVVPDLRGQGLGDVLTTAAEAWAAAAGVGTLYLLTTTAEGYFARRGYRVFPRDAAPAGIRGTAEFARLCPASAVFMGKVLASVCRSGNGSRVNDEGDCGNAGPDGPADACTGV